MDQVRHELEAIASNAVATGIELVMDVPEDLRAFQGSTVSLQWLARQRKIDKTKPAPKGSGRTLLLQLVEWADRHEIHLQLGITNDRAWKKLQSYYEQFGFIRTDPLDNYDRIMVREPVEQEIENSPRPSSS